MTALWNTAFAWAGPAPTLIDLTDPEDDDDNAYGNAPPRSLGCFYFFNANVDAWTLAGLRGRL